MPTCRIMSDYSYAMHRNPKELALVAMEKLEGVKFDTLVGRGLSGSIVIPMLAHFLECHWLIIRKRGASSHSLEIAEGTLGDRWLFVDDFICTGTTRQEVKKAVEQLNERYRPDDPSEFMGSYLYKQGYYYSPPEQTPPPLPPPPTLSTFTDATFMMDYKAVMPKFMLDEAPFRS